MLKATPEFDWPQYFEASDAKGRLHPLFGLLDPLLRPGFKALDLGCGVGRGVCHLAELGLEVTAVDIYKEALERLERRLAGHFPVQLVEADLRGLAFHEHSHDVVVATSVLYFLSPSEFSVFWPKLVGWIRPGGYFAGQFMGPNDPWVTREDYNFQTPETVARLFEGFEILHSLEDERDSPNAVGDLVHMHQIQVLARRR
jgi:cyclopropane fatty-acyl-phospholipid synthase-like methyltransferase